MDIHGLVTLALVLATSIPIIFAICRNFWTARYKRLHHLNFYTDHDGTASPESQQAFSTVIPVSLALFAVASGVALSITAALVEISSRQAHVWALDDWCKPASWVGTAIVLLIHFLVDDHGL